MYDKEQILELNSKMLFDCCSSKISNYIITRMNSKFIEENFNREKHFRLPMYFFDEQYNILDDLYVTKFPTGEINIEISDRVKRGNLPRNLMGVYPYNPEATTIIMDLKV